MRYPNTKLARLKSQSIFDIRSILALDSTIIKLRDAYEWMIIFYLKYQMTDFFTPIEVSQAN